jgi:hypothetical protein
MRNHPHKGQVYQMKMRVRQTKELKISKLKLPIITCLKMKLIIKMQYNITILLQNIFKKNHFLEQQLNLKDL